MPIFYILSALLLAACAFWLRREERGRSRFAYALYLLLAYDLLRLVAVWGGLEDLRWLGLSQLIPWAAVLLAGLALPWWTASLLLLGAPLAFLYPAPVTDALTWGFLPALPLSTLIYLQRQRAFPILAPRPLTPRRRPAQVVSRLARQDISAQRPILECIEDGVVVTREGTVEYVNQAAATIMGVGAEEFVGQAVAETMAWLPARPAMTSDDGTSTQSEVDLNGRIVQQQMSIVYNEAGAVQGTVVVLRDVTDARRAEQAKAAFLTTVSHELRTPLTTLKGYVELMQSNVGGNLSSQQQQFLKTIRRNVQRMVQLVNGLIFVASVKGERFSLPEQRANVKRLAQQIAREMGPAAGQTGQQIEVNVDDRLPAIQADPIHLSTILQELVSNAIKYNRPGGTIRINATLETTDDREQQFAAISVKDEGIGISPQDQLQIFDDFYRPDRREEEVRAGGLGMGLSIVRALVEAYNGRIWVESRAGTGSAFTFIIPTQQPDSSAASAFLDPDAAPGM